jgi:hypothetical protein
VSRSHPTPGVDVLLRMMCAAGCVAVLGATAWAMPQAVSVVPITPVTPGQKPAAPAPASPAPVTITPVNTNPAPAPPPAAEPLAQAAPMPPAARKLSLAFSKGRVTLVAANVTLHDILAEWTRVGGTTFVDVDKVTGGTVSLQFTDAPEYDVLQSILRPLAGNVVDPPIASPAPNKSIYAVVTLLPTSHASTSGYVPPPPVMQQSMPDDELPPVRPAMPAPSPGTSGPTPVVVAPVTPTGPGRGGGPGGVR